MKEALLPARVYLFKGDSLLIPPSMSEEDCLAGVPQDLALNALGPAHPEWFMGACLLEASQALPPGWKALPVRTVLSRSGGGEDRLLRSYHLLQWRGESRFCGSCGAPNGDSPAEVARLCPRCGRIEYPRISPAIIVLITRGRDSILLAHNRKFSPGIYSLIAGFNEAGESLEATLHREVREELGIEVEDIRYQVSQSWPFPNSLMAGFTAAWASGEIHPDGMEIEDAHWYRRENLPQIPSPGTISRRLINLWQEGTL
ncbi:MAG: NAD(+) diphosphatase [Treponema sp.]|jgi:NAD+ diphosphatase|nr:NAD(+) diphosphatase [Treponema sp.]